MSRECTLSFQAQMVERDSPVRSRTAGKRRSVSDSLRAPSGPCARCASCALCNPEAVAGVWSVGLARTGPLVFAGSGVMKNLSCLVPLLIREQCFGFIAISCPVVASHPYELVYIAPSVCATQMEHEVNRVRDLLPYGLIRQLDATLQDAR